MKTLSILTILAGALFITACDNAQKPKIKNPLAGHVKALKKAKEVENLIQEATKNRLKQVDGIE